jgi:hypothetical protein
MFQMMPLLSVTLFSVLAGTEESGAEPLDH